MINKIILISFSALLFSCGSLISLDGGLNDVLSTSIDPSESVSGKIVFKSKLKEPHKNGTLEIPINGAFKSMLNEYAEQRYPSQDQSKNAAIDVQLNSLDINYKLEQSDGQKAMGVLSALVGDGKQSGMAKVTSKLKFSVTYKSGDILKTKNFVSKTSTARSITGKRDELNMTYKKSIDKTLSRAMVYFHKFIVKNEK
jgi:hypothetical protein